jgi:hypothetical protein
MKSWHLIAPEWAALDTIWRSPLPFLLWPVCEKPLLTYWLDEAVRQGIESISLEALDRPHLIRQWLEGSALWSRSIEVITQPGGGEGREHILIEGLPGQTHLPPVQTPKELMQRWYDLQVEALNRRSSGIIHLDHEYQPGVWFGPGAIASSNVVFTPPCWVGSHARIDAGCRVGPYAFIGRGAFLDEDVEVVESIVCADTFVGSHISLNRMAAQGGLLMDFERGVGVEVQDAFVLSSTESTTSTPSLLERLVAFALYHFLTWLAALVNHGRQPTDGIYQLSRSKMVCLRTYPKGPLCLRRAPWLQIVAEGKMKIIGVLPRSEEDWKTLSPESRSVLEQAPTGVFALSDLYGCHTAREPDEWLHAVFQAGHPNHSSAHHGWSLLLKVIFLNPPES